MRKNVITSEEFGGQFLEWLNSYWQIANRIHIKSHEQNIWHDS